MLSDMKPVGFVMTTDYARARAFYEGVLGLEILEEGEWALVARVGEGTLRVVKLKEVNATPHTVFGFEVPDIASAVQALAAKGVAFEQFDFLGEAQTSDGIWTAPGDRAKVAWFRDPDGNSLSLSWHAA